MYEASKLIEAVRELANKYPNAVYSFVDEGRCFYTKGDVKVGDSIVSCGCIMGQAILKAYPDSQEKLQQEDVGTISSIGGVASIWGFGYTAKELDWMDYVQLKQDEGKTWGMAVKMADTMIPLS